MSTVPWTPESIQTTMWLDAAEISNLHFRDGVDFWWDKSGNGIAAWNNNTTLQPQYDSVDKGVIFGGPGGDFLYCWDLEPFMVAKHYMIFAVMQKLAGGLQYAMGGQGSVTNGVLHFGWRDDNTITLAQFANDVNGGMTVPLNTRHMLTGTLSTAGKTIRGNGTQLGSGTNATRLVSFYRPGICRHSTVSMDLTIHEFIIVTTDGTLTNMEKIEGYLAHKWGIEGSLPAGHPYKSAAPTVPADIVAEAGGCYTVDTSATLKNALMPAAPTPGDTVRFSDYAGTFGTNPLLIHPNDKPIRSYNHLVTLNVNRQSVELTFFDDTIGWGVTG